MSKPEKIIYKATSTSTGGRDGRSKSSDGIIDLPLAVPTEMGGKGGATNPEQLFASGYSACFLGAIRFVAGKEKVQISPDASVKAEVGIGEIPGGFGIDVDLTISLPGLDKAQAQALVEKAHHVCPYSNATRNNVDVRLHIA
jgi:Ohr subfamily peroxiredoxin